MNFIVTAVRKIRNYFRREEAARLIEAEPDTHDNLEHLERNYYGTADTVSAQYDFFDAKCATVSDLTYLCFPLEPLDTESYRKPKETPTETQEEEPKETPTKKEKGKKDKKKGKKERK